MKKTKAPVSNRERRSITHKIELRKAADGSRTIVGYGAVFSPARSEFMGFYEQIDPRAFDGCLASSPDVACLWNHDTNHVLGRTPGTLKLSTDATGLLYRCKLPDTQIANDLAVSMERGDVHQSSFGFICTQDSWQELPNGDLLRTVLKATVFDVSPVTFPAYTDATAAIRSCPTDLRSKLKRDAQDDPDDTDDDNDDCDCDCDDCMDDRCEQCSAETCDDDVCADAGCPAAGETQRLRLLLKHAQLRAAHTV